MPAAVSSSQRSNTQSANRALPQNSKQSSKTTPRPNQKGKSPAKSDDEEADEEEQANDGDEADEDDDPPVKKSKKKKPKSTAQAQEVDPPALAKYLSITDSITKGLVGTIPVLTAGLSVWAILKSRSADKATKEAKKTQIVADLKANEAEEKRKEAEEVQKSAEERHKALEEQALQLKEREMAANLQGAQAREAQNLAAKVEADAKVAAHEAELSKQRALSAQADAHRALAEAELARANAEKAESEAKSARLALETERKQYFAQNHDQAAAHSESSSEHEEKHSGNLEIHRPSSMDAPQNGDQVGARPSRRTAGPSCNRKRDTQCLENSPATDMSDHPGDDGLQNSELLLESERQYNLLEDFVEDAPLQPSQDLLALPTAKDVANEFTNEILHKSSTTQLSEGGELVNSVFGEKDAQFMEEESEKAMSSLLHHA